MKSKIFNFPCCANSPLHVVLQEERGNFSRSRNERMNLNFSHMGFTNFAEFSDKKTLLYAKGPFTPSESKRGSENFL